MKYEETMAAWKATVSYLRCHGIKFSGIYHQAGRYGVPYFDNGKKLCLDNQSWGYLMEEVLEMKQDCIEDMRGASGRIGLNRMNLYSIWGNT